MKSKSIIEKQRKTNRIHIQTYDESIDSYVKFSHVYFLKNRISLLFHTFDYNNAGYIKKIQLMDGTKLYQCSSLFEFICKLDELIDDNNLQKYNKNSKDALLIYTKDIKKVFYFLLSFYKDKLNVFEHNGIMYCFTIKDVIEVRDISQFYDDRNINSIYDLHNKTRELWQFFELNNNVYLTPTQFVIKMIKKGDTSMAKEIFPVDITTYNKLLKSYFGGVCICNYPEKIIDKPVIEYDRTSAYIYDLLIEKHACEPLQKVDPKDANFYIDFEEDYFALMTVKIKLTRLTYGIKCFKQIDGKRIKPGENIMCITNTDFNLLNKIAIIEDYECLELYVSKKDYLPEDLRKVIEDQYFNKMAEPTILNKKKLNSIYGACVKKLDFNKMNGKPYLTPQWGILTASYARRNLLNVALQLKGWLYSDTDSIFCLDTPENKEIIDKANQEMEDKILKIYYNHDKLDILKKLGKFKVEVKCKKFKANTTKQYMYTTIDGKVIFRGSGITGENNTEEVYEHINTGTKKIGKYNPNVTKCIIDGETYISDGSYYYEVITDEDDVTRVINFMLNNLKGEAI